jgi:hypothetical protein
MWENRCKVAVSGVGFSKVSRTADIPLAAHALTAVKEAVADSGLAMSDIDVLATYPELPATGHAEIDGISIVGHCMMAMLKLPNDLAHPGRHHQHGGAGGRRKPFRRGKTTQSCGRRCTTRAAPTRICRSMAAGATQFTAPYGFGGRGRMAVAYPAGSSATTRTREDGDPRRDAAQTHPAQPARLFPRHRADARRTTSPRAWWPPFCLFDCDIPVQGRGRDRPDHRRPARD